MATASRILGDEVGSTAPAFLAILAVHVVAGLTAVITGPIAALTRKGSPGHIRAGHGYYRAITVVSAPATPPPPLPAAPARRGGTPGPPPPAGPLPPHNPAA